MRLRHHLAKFREFARTSQHVPKTISIERRHDCSRLGQAITRWSRWRSPLYSARARRSGRRNGGVAPSTDIPTSNGQEAQDQETHRMPVLQQRYLVLRPTLCQDKKILLWWTSTTPKQSQTVAYSSNLDAASLGCLFKLNNNEKKLDDACCERKTLVGTFRT